MAEWQGLWSYVHADDEADLGRVSQLARDVAAQFEMLTGESIELFLDRDAIAWGEDWRAKVDEGLASIAFFIAVITPRYFKSPECRRELQSFARKAQSLGITDLVLPLLYVDVPALHEEEPKDDLVELISGFHWIDWQVHRFEDPTSGSYRFAVSELAARLVAANDRVEVLATESPALPEASVDDIDEAGTLDKMAESETAMQEWTSNLEAITSEIDLVGQLMTQASQEMAEADAKHGTFAARLAVTKRLAAKLQEPADRILEQSNASTSQLHRVDEGLRLIIESLPAEIEADPDARAEACEFFEVVRNLSNSAHEALESTVGMIESSKEIESVSRDLRKPLRTLNQGLTTMVEGREVSDEWLRLIDESGIDCGSVPG